MFPLIYYIIIHILSFFLPIFYMSYCSSFFPFSPPDSFYLYFFLSFPYLFLISFRLSSYFYIFLSSISSSLSYLSLSHFSPIIIFPYCTDISFLFSFSFVISFSFLLLFTLNHFQLFRFFSRTLSSFLLYIIKMLIRVFFPIFSFCFPIYLISLKYSS